MLPDQGPSDDGTLLIPSTIALISGAPHAENGKKLIDFLCDPSVEKELIVGRFFVGSVRDPGKIKGMNVEYEQSAHQMRAAVETALRILQDRSEQRK